MNINLKRAIVGLALLFSMGTASATSTNISIMGGYESFSNPVLGHFDDSYNFPSLPLSLWSGNNPLFQGPTTTTFQTLLNTGSYTLRVADDAIGSNGDIYYLAAVPVPEPSSWAMMLGGFGLIGFMSYRRRQYF